MRDDRGIYLAVTLSLLFPSLLSSILHCVWFPSRLQRVEGFADRVRSALEAASADPTAHLYDPVNAFQLVNRYINGWGALHDDLYKDNAQGEQSCLPACLCLCFSVYLSVCLSACLPVSVCLSDG